MTATKKPKNPRPLVEALSPDEYRQALSLIGADHNEFARFAGVSLRTGYRWRDYGLAAPASTFLQTMILLGVTIDDLQPLFDAAGLERIERMTRVKGRSGKSSQVVGQVVYAGIPKVPRKKIEKRNDGGSGKRAAAPSGAAHEGAGP